MRITSPLRTVASNVNEIQKLYLTHESSPGSVFFLPRGTRIVAKLTAFMRAQLKQHKYDEVITPQIFKKHLWVQSGHWAHYRDDMFGVTGANTEYSLKPMNCPSHCLIFKSQERSFRDMPLRLADFSPLHRNEASGALSGLTRVRRFHQDDGHIFCRQDQVLTEIGDALKLIKTVYKVFNLSYSACLSTRPQSYIGTVEQWDKAEEQLKQAIGSSTNININPGDGAFYGPKIDITVLDSSGKSHQVATLQLDFQLPRLFELQYDGHDQNLHQPILIHRAVFGSIERFLAILMEHYNGKWPFWLNPLQAVVLPVSEKHLEYARKVALQLQQGGENEISPVPLNKTTFDVELWDQSESLGRRIRRCIKHSASYIIVVGDEEVKNNTLSVKERGNNGSQQREVMPIETLIDTFRKRQQLYN